jgi:hypothetical protein
MKKLLVLLFSLFFLSSPSVFADDISDFQIEGISIGDSLLDYMTEDEILENIERTKDFFAYLKEPNKYAEVYLSQDFSIYERMSFFIKNNSTNQYVTNKNEKYTILLIRGLISYIEDFDSCIQKRDEIVEVLSKMFSNTQKTEMVWTDETEPSGNSIFDDVTFTFDSGGNIVARCNNWDENYRIKNNFSEGLSIAISTKEIFEWGTDYK